MTQDYNSKNVNRQIQGARSKAVGDLFEQLIDMACNQYKRKQIALIEKTPEPMRPIKNLGAGKFIAHFEKQAQPDYKGTCKGGKSIVFEAKHTDKDRIEQSRVTDEQRDALNLHFDMGAICFVLVSIGLENFYRVPWDVWRNMKAIYNHKHMKVEELEEFKVAEKNGLIMLLEGLEG